MRKALLILSLIVFTASGSIAQDGGRGTPTEAVGKVKLYPNPAISYITFDLQKNFAKGLNIVVYNFLGKKMYESQGIAEKTTVTLNDFARGVYIYHVTDVSGKVLDTGKFQVSR
ncbi:MAG: T9SS type A sorting domain-containing protein [Chitinophagaceae bacterium]|nr:T9SS type A sorting domain-containing protein [Chitinophagaceae bacterium]